MIYAQVLANNYATTMDIDAPLQRHMDQYGRGCQAAINARALYDIAGTRLIGQAQADMFFMLDDGTVLQSAREGDAAITGGFVGRARARGYDEEDDVEAIKAMLVDPANSVDGLAVRCIADETPVREEDGVCRADGFLTGALHYGETYVRPIDQALANADAHRAELAMLRNLAIENGTALEGYLGKVFILEGDRTGVRRRNHLKNGKPFGAEGTFGDGERLWDSTADLGKLLAGKGGTVLDATLRGFNYAKELGTSLSIKAIPSGMVMIVSNDYAPGGTEHERMKQFKAASEKDTAEPLLYRESFLVEALKRDGDLSFEGHKLHSMYEWDDKRLVERGESLLPSPGYVLRTNGPNGETYGVPAPATQRLPRAAPPAPAPAPVTNDPLGEYTDDKVPLPGGRGALEALTDMYCKRFSVKKPPKTPTLYPGNRAQWLRERIREGPQ